MKPLNDIDTFLKRFNHFKDGEFRSIEIHSPSTMLVTLAGQDEARAFNWISVQIEFTSITDARLLDDTQYKLIDMNSGISIIKNDNTLAFGIGECYNESNIKTSSCYLVSKNAKYQEGQF